MIQFFMQVSQRTRDLIEAIRKLDYGTLRNVEITDTEEKTVGVDIDGPTQKLVNVIQEGNLSFSQIRVHNSTPVLVEQDFEYLGFKGTKQIKLT